MKSHKTRKHIAIFMVLAMLCSILPTGAVWAEEDIDEYVLDITANKTTLIKGSDELKLTIAPRQTVTTESASIFVYQAEPEAGGDGAVLGNENAEIVLDADNYSYTFTREDIATLDVGEYHVHVGFIVEVSDYYGGDFYFTVKNPSSGGGSGYVAPSIDIDTVTREDGNGQSYSVIVAEPSVTVRSGKINDTITSAEGEKIINKAVVADAQQMILDYSGKNADSVSVKISDDIVEKIAERTDSGLMFKTAFADISLSDKDLDKYKGSLDMKAAKADTDYSAKVSIGDATLIDIGVKLPVGVELTDDMKLVVAPHTPSADNLAYVLGIDADTEYLDADNVKIQIVGGEDYTAPDGTEYRMHEIIIINGEEYLITNYMGVGDVLVLMRLSDGATGNYNVAVNKLDFTGSMNGTIQEYAYDKINIGGITYDVRLSYNSDAGRVVVLYYNGSPAGKMYINESRSSYFREGFDPETLKVQQNENDLGTVTFGEHPIDGLENGKTYNVSVIGSNDIHLEGAENIGGTVTQTFDIPVQFVNNPNVKYAAVHITNPHAEALEEAFNTWRSMREKLYVAARQYENGEILLEELNKAKQSEMESKGEYRELEVIYDTWEKEQAANTGRGKELGVVTVSEDGKTVTASYAVDSFSPFTIYALEKQPMRIVMEIDSNVILANGERIVSDVPPTIVDDRTMVPISIITYLLGGEAVWNGDTQQVTLYIGGRTLSMTIGEVIPGVGTAPFITDGRTMVPAAYVMDYMGCAVTWNSGTRQIVIEE